MLIFLTLLISVSVLALFVAGLLAFLRNSKKPQNRWFFALCIVLTIWIPSNFYDSNFVRPFWTDAATKLDFLSALFIGWVFVGFVEKLSIRSRETRPMNKVIELALQIGLLLNILFIPVGIFNLLIKTSIDQQTLMIHYGPAFNLYVTLLCFYFLYGLARLLYIRYRASLAERPALNLVFAGLFIAIVANLLTNLLFPTTISSHTIVKDLNIFGYLGLVAFALLIYLAITTQKLFDIKSFVARSLGYLLALGSLGGLFFIITLAITSVIFGNSLSDAQARWVYVSLAAILALIFPPLKRFFDTVTSKIFYRDAYNTQELLDDLNQVLVSTYDLDTLLKESSGVISSCLKPRFCVFAINATQNTAQSVTGTTGHPPLKNEDIKLISTNAIAMSKKLLVTDDLEDKGIDEKTKKLLQKDEIAVIARLTSVNTKEGVGHLILGYKKSGNLYSSQDIKVLEIITNELVIAIQNALRFKEIENFNITLQQRVDDATRKLRRANEKLKTLDETKDDFISMASHQLRTPLTSVKGYLSMVIDGDAGKITAMQHNMLGQAYFSSQRMVYLIADLLNVSRLKTGKFIIEASRINLADVVEQEMKQLEETAAGHAITLVYEKPKNFPDLMLDETKIRQVIMNFADNAIYYTPANGHITVKLLNNDASIELRVEDDGIGVPKSEQPHLFTKFYRADNARKARPDGTGLGLFMAKKVVIAQGGAIIFESQQGKGSTFGFTFSKAKVGVEKPTTKIAAPKLAKKAN